MRQHFDNSVGSGGNECAMNRWITNEQAEEQAALYPSWEKNLYLSMLHAHAESHMRFVLLTAFLPVILNGF